MGQHPDFFVRRRAAANPALPMDVLLRLAEDDTRPPKRCDAAARGDDDYDTIQSAAASNPGLPIAKLTELAQRHPFEVAHNLATPANLLAQLAQIPACRPWVAGHPNTSHEVLAQLVGDEQWGVRTAMAEGGTLSVELMARLAADGQPTVRRAIASRADLAAPLIPVLAQDDDATVRGALAGYHPPG